MDAALVKLIGCDIVSDAHEHMQHMMCVHMCMHTTHTPVTRYVKLKACG